MVEATSAVSADIDTVYVDGTPLGLDSHLTLVDDGATQGDWAAGDDVWTYSLAGLLPDLEGEDWIGTLPLSTRGCSSGTP
jgi:hypothetical protein